MSIEELKTGLTTTAGNLAAEQDLTQQAVDKLVESRGPFDAVLSVQEQARGHCQHIAESINDIRERLGALAQLYVEGSKAGDAAVALVGQALTVQTTDGKLNAAVEPVRSLGGQNREAIENILDVAFEALKYRRPGTAVLTTKDLRTRCLFFGEDFENAVGKVAEASGALEQLSSVQQDIERLTSEPPRPHWQERVWDKGRANPDTAIAHTSNVRDALGIAATEVRLWNELL